MTVRNHLKYLVLCLSMIALAACGFQLRGPKPMAFKTIYLAMGQYSELAADLKRQIRTSGTTVAVNTPQEAEVTLVVLQEHREKTILSLGPTGTVREYQLLLRFQFRLQDKAGKEVLPLQEINITRDITFNDSLILAKEQEEALLYRDMQNDLVQQVTRRLSAARMPAAAAVPPSATTPAPAITR